MGITIMLLNKYHKKNNKSLWKIIGGGLALSAISLNAQNDKLKSFNHSSVVHEKYFDKTSVWKISNTELKLLKRDCLGAFELKSCLIQFMIKNGASIPAIAFTKSQSGEPCFLESIEEANTTDGFTTGRICRPFSMNSISELVIVNGYPKVINVGDPIYLSKINFTNDPFYKKIIIKNPEIKIWPTEAKFIGIQPGEKNRTEVEVRYPLKSQLETIPLCYVYVVFEFGWPIRQFLGAKLEYISEK